MPTKHEFTIRNKQSSTPIFTLASFVMERFLQARPDSVALVLSKYRADYKTLTGKSITLHFEQVDALKAHYGTDAKGAWTSRYSMLDSVTFQVRNCFQNGFLTRTLSSSLLTDLEIVESFFSMLDVQISKTSAPVSVEKAVTEDAMTIIRKANRPHADVPMGMD